MARCKRCGMKECCGADLGHPIDLAVMALENAAARHRDPQLGVIWEDAAEEYEAAANRLKEAMKK